MKEFVIGLCLVAFGFFWGVVLANPNPISDRSCPSYANVSLENIPARCLSYFAD